VGGTEVDVGDMEDGAHGRSIVQAFLDPPYIPPTPFSPPGGEGGAPPTLLFLFLGVGRS